MRLRSILVPDVLQAAAIIGGFTAFGAALAAIAQRDVRRVLAWSTISQVGLMFVAAGVGALFAARFQLIAHALLKAVLVLGGGSVRRATRDESDVGKYGGLGTRMPWTAGAFAIGTLALAGIPPAAGFFTIAAIVSAAFSNSDALLTALVLLAAATLAFAGVRLFALIFVAPPALEREADEPPPLQDIPLALLALGALGFGVVVSAGILPIGSGPADDAPLWLLVATLAIALVSSIAAWLGYRRGVMRATWVVTRLERAIDWARGGLGIDTLYVRGVARPFAVVARELEVRVEPSNERVIDAVGWIAVRASLALRRAHPASARAQQALLLAGAVALLAFWTWSAW
jgi:NADH-quinone oxidoreductase subunit L